MNRTALARIIHDRVLIAFFHTAFCVFSFAIRPKKLAPFRCDENGIENDVFTAIHDVIFCLHFAVVNNPG